MYSELLARLEAATGPDRELDAAIALWAGWTRHHGQYEWMKPNGFFSTVGCPAYTASIDAALTLVPADATGYMVSVVNRSAYACVSLRDGFEGNAPTPALAIVIAAIRAA